jgi:hypothetical protein
VIYACERVAERLNVDPVFSDKLNGLISTLEA